MGEYRNFFLWRQSKQLLHILLQAGADFITSQVMLDVMYLSFSFQMYADRVVLFEYFLFENESLWVYILCLKVPFVESMKYFVV